jgi:endo-1,4-beta-xylanase
VELHLKNRPGEKEPMNRIFCMAIVLLFTAVAIARPARADNLLAGKGWGLMCPAPGDAQMTTASANDGKGVLRITVVKPSEPFYRIMIAQTIAPAIPEGTRLRLRFRARSETGNPVRAVIEKNGPPFTPTAEINPTLTKEWKLYTVTGTQQAAYGPNGLGARFQFGHQAGTLELEGITLENLGPDPDLAAAQAAIAPEAIRERIRQYRTGDMKIVARDGKGKAVQGATIKVEQTRHAFLFGCNFFHLDPAGAEPWQKEYQGRFTALFNYATLPFYWGGFEWQKGKPQYDRLEAMAKWCAAHGIEAKGHPLVWHEVWPVWAPKDPDAAIPLLRQRILDIIPRYKGLIRYWDVQNEANNSADYPNTGVGAWVKRDGPAAVVATTLGWAREASKGLGDTLLYNDFNTGQQNLDLLAALQAKGALPDAIGIQSHMHGGPWPLTQVWATAQKFSRFGRPIHFTETTVLSGPRREFNFNNPPRDWETTPEDEVRQADYVEQFYSLLFSHPSVRAITWWDFTDRGAWLNAPAGFLRKDMSPKPVYDRLMKLIHGEWWTQARGTTGASGEYKTRAFYGDYRVTVTDAQGRTITQNVSFPMGSGAKTVTVTVK